MLACGGRIKRPHPRERRSLIRINHSKSGRGLILLGALITLAPACSPPTELLSRGSVPERLTPAQTPLPEDYVSRRVYASVYSSIYLGLHSEDQMPLAATVSVRNLSVTRPIVIVHARYYDSAGKAVRDYVSAPAILGPMATVEFVIKRNDVVGGPGANLLIEWSGPADIDEPIVESVMIGQSGNASFSFTSQGRRVLRP